jgi:ferritin-like metal-binding protein YciE
MTKIKTIQELFIDQLQDRYSAAQQQAKAFKQLYNASTHQDLKQILKDDIVANENHLKNLKTLLEDVNANPQGEYCEGTAGLVKEAIDALHLFEEGNVLDVAIAISVQHINHHDIAGYNGCAIIAKRMKNSKMQKAVEQMLEDEKKTDTNLNEFLKKQLVIHSTY